MAFILYHLRDHTVVKLLLNLKKYAQLDNIKVLGIKPIVFNIFSRKKQNKINGLVRVVWFDYLRT